LNMDHSSLGKQPNRLTTTTRLAIRLALYKQALWIRALDWTAPGLLDGPGP
jgi:hypothetical protein